MIMKKRICSTVIEKVEVDRGPLLPMASRKSRYERGQTAATYFVPWDGLLASTRLRLGEPDQLDI
jgi:hypothetical protein